MVGLNLKRLFPLTALPAPSNMRVEKIFETQIKLSWDVMVLEQHAHTVGLNDTAVDLVYHVRVVDDLGNLAGQQFVNNSTALKLKQLKRGVVSCWMHNLTPGRWHSASLQVSGRFKGGWVKGVVGTYRNMFF